MSGPPLNACRIELLCLLLALLASLRLPHESLAQEDKAVTETAKSELFPFLGTPIYSEAQVFEQGRFPNIVVATDGTLLAFLDGVVLKRSTNGGLTWSEPISIAKGLMGGGVTVDDKSGNIFVFIEASHPPAPLQIFVSSDQGLTWTEQAVKILPNQLGHVPSMHMNEHGLTLRHAPHTGRLIRPTRWYAKANYPPENFPTHYTNAMYSDDGGVTWQASEPFPAMGTGEATIVELANGELYYNTRRHWAPTGENPRRRWTARSLDGGATWQDLAICEVLPDGDQNRDYGLMGGLDRLPLHEQDILIFSNIDSPAGRRQGTLWVSFDGGRTWPLRRLAAEGEFAYSSVAVGKAGTPTEGYIYLMYEKGGQGAVVARFNLAWLLEGELTGDGEVPSWITAAQAARR